jgi:hypothetical protein
MQLLLLLLSFSISLIIDLNNNAFNCVHSLRFVNLRRYSRHELNIHQDIQDESLSLPNFHTWKVDLLSLINSTNTIEESFILPEFRESVGHFSASNVINFSSSTYRNSYFQYIRSVIFFGNGYNVFNFVIFPKIEYDIPIFGVDIVSLPGAHNIYIYILDILYLLA